MNEKKLVPRRRFEEFQNADAWEQRKLKTVVEVRSGRDYKHLSHGDIPVYGTGGYMLSVNEALSYDEDAIGIGRKGTIDRPYILRAPFWTVDTLFYVIPKEKYNLNFVYSVFQRVNWKQKDESTGVPSLSKTTINEIHLAIPKYDEQTEIGHFFSELDNLIALHQRKLEKTKAMKSAYLAEIFPAEGERVPKRRFAGFTDEWKKFEVNKFADRYNNLRIPITESKRIPGTTPYYGANGIQDYVEGYTHSGEFILLAEDGANNIFDYPVQYVNGKVWVNNHAHVLQAKVNKADNKFLIYLFKKVEYKRYLVGGGRSKLNSDVLMSIELLLPTITEQQLIGEFFKKLDESITNQQQKLKKLKAIKQAYLAEMFV